MKLTSRFLTLLLVHLMLAGLVSQPATATQTDFPGPAKGGALGLGTGMVVLPSGNIVVTDPDFNLGSTQRVGAVFVYSPNGTVISTLTGSHAGDQVGYNDQTGNGASAITVLSNGNFVISSSHWNGGMGAVTWGSGTTGVSGVVSASNSLVGSAIEDQVGAPTSGGVVSLGNGNYVVVTSTWSNGGNTAVGAVTWGDGSAGTSGTISASNSLIGSTTSDQVGLDGVTVLSNGNYVVITSGWNNARGAVTWGSGTVGVTGEVSASNSLVGSNETDAVGVGGVVALADNGNYVVFSSDWSNGSGAATWGNGTTGIVGTVNATNSFVGDSGGLEDLIPLTNGNYVIVSSLWNNNTGAVTWADGTTGITGTASASNSLVGASTDQQVGGAGVTALTNGNYVVASPSWNSGAGAITWANGASGLTGNISTANSLVGDSANAQVGSGEVTPLPNGNYVAISADWNSGAGAVTWADGSAATTGSVGPTNSLTGVVADEVVALPSSNFVVLSKAWNSSTGAATWGSGTTGIVGTVSAANSLVGSAVGDEISGNGVTVLSNGNYVVVSAAWSSGKGAVTWGDGATGVKGVVSAANSLVGSTFGDEVGANDHVGGDRNGVVALTNGNYVVSSPNWNVVRGAATWGSGTAGVKGVITSTNSLVGSTPLDAVSEYEVTPLSDGNYVVFSPHWHSGSPSLGAVTLGVGSTGTVGLITAANSVIGSTANQGDTMVFDYVASLSLLAVGRPGDNILSLFTYAVVPTVFTVTTPDGAISDGGSQSFGSVLTTTKPSIVFTVTNTGAGSINSLVINKDGTDKASFVITSALTPPIASGASKTFTVQFAPTTAGMKTAALHIIGNGVVANPFDITLTGTATLAVAPVVATTAATGIAFDGATLHGTVNAKGSLRNITFEHGLTTTALTSVAGIPATLDTGVATPVASAQLTGLAPHTKYSFRVKADGALGTATGAFLTFTTADRAPTTMPDTAVALPSAKITIHPLANDSDPDMDTLSIFSFTQPGAAVGTVAKSGTDLIFTPAAGFNGGQFTYIAADAFGGKSAATTVTLQLGSIVAASTIDAASDQTPIAFPVMASAPFTVVEALPWLSFSPILPNDTQVTFIFAPNPTLVDRSGVIKVGGQAVTVTQHGIPAIPVLDTPNPVPDAAISAAYDLAIVTHNGPVTYTATGLPTGLTLSNVTGHITGMPTVAVANKPVTIFAKNAKGTSNTINFTITVQAFPTSLIGGYTAILPRSTGLVNSDLGGLLTFNVAANGPVTGTLKSGAGSYGFSGRPNTAVNPASPDPLHARLSVSVPRVKGDPTPLLLVVNMNTPTDGQVSGTVTLGANVVNFTGTQNVWSFTGHAAATEYLGSFTAALQPTNASLSLPQGDGFLTFSVTNKGVITWNGQLADGTVIAAGTTNLGPAGEVPLFASLYTGKGSVLGMPIITATTRVFAGNLSWSKTATTGRAYAAGFGADNPLDLSVVGGLYTPPKGAAVLTNVTAPSGSGSITFLDGGIEAVGMYSNLPQTITISTANVATLPPTVPGNPANVRVTKIDATKGTFIGSLTLKDPNPFNGALPQVSRTVPFNGVFLQGSHNIGTGYFLLPAISGPPANTTTSPQTSGQVKIEPNA